MDEGAWWATAHGVAKSQTRLSDFTSLHFSVDVSPMSVHLSPSLPLRYVTVNLNPLEDTELFSSSWYRPQTMFKIAGQAIETPW